MYKQMNNYRKNKNGNGGACMEGAHKKQSMLSTDGPQKKTKNLCLRLLKPNSEEIVARSTNNANIYEMNTHIV